MLSQIQSLKKMFIAAAMKQAEDHGPERVDGELIDMIKDISEAEYYCMMMDSMDNKGATITGYSSPTMTASMDYQEIITPLRSAIQAANPDDRDHLRNEVKAIIGAL